MHPTAHGPAFADRSCRAPRRSAGSRTNLGHPCMPARLPWRRLLPGLLALAVIVAGAAVILAYAGVTTVHGRTIRLYVLSGQASGVMHGTEVWLSGQKVGSVERISFPPPTADSMARVLIELTVRERDARLLHRDSHADLRA